MTEFAEATDGYQGLDPEQVLAAVDSQGLHCDGRLLEMNSFENRVYQLGLDDGTTLITKFYRPNRWSDEAILEEHAFSLDLAAREVNLVPPMADAKGNTLRFYRDFRFALFERRGGRPPDFEDVEQLCQLGRFIGRMHAIGGEKQYQHRPTLDVTTFGSDCSQFLLEHEFIPADLVPAYASLTEDLIQRVTWCYQRCPDLTLIRTHGDCHRGNILWTDEGPHLVDLDDSRMAPAMQDLWMFLSGEREEREHALNALLDGYTVFTEFDPAELNLIEALRTLRLMHYFAWIAGRWTDPAFPRAFPWFNTPRSWEQHILDLREQAALMDEPPLTWQPTG
ncbi:MAG: serine/threonine protein kinase [Acidiferrobacteraceae bacterium]|jgi:Ser/Thr protein kinase RdoA (MazF antagonist)|nr:serine/threonine protein kinase [Acidiferrobacteraceae bacterium]MDP6398221.1 serine/threonine protein kinase [Arenicellales bacterium]MDP6552058.1 serine/threonine protein kinase [Arenicellales bacterium]MDP6791570.1 serine/threonine protein kinase [Arenicellales bacterium]MDP6918004.1 serine/threonine protein kinase [Arenicellales bacterium]|tara:strand:+ start:6104 stop:7111 length:1008 start_codon:yes stop_codon:yes gene_type:complete